jgi:hypothetical protein
MAKGYKYYQIYRINNASVIIRFGLRKIHKIPPLTQEVRSEYELYPLSSAKCH